MYLLLILKRVKFIRGSVNKGVVTDTHGEEGPSTYKSVNCLQPCSMYRIPVTDGHCINNFCNLVLYLAKCS